MRTGSQRRPNRHFMIGPPVFVAASVAVVIAAGCHPAQPPVTPVQVAPAAAIYVGSANCSACHPGEFAAWKGGRHAHTLQLVTVTDLGSLAPKAGPVPATTFTLMERAGEFAIGDPAHSDEVMPLKYALGSGKTGMTYVTPMPDGRLLEFHMSYFPHQKAWYVTPGQQSLAPDDVGKIHPVADGRKCILCHAVDLPDQGSNPAPEFFGVGCESCHGPGSAHVAAMKGQASSAGKVENIGSWPASRINDLCGKCHGTRQEVETHHLPASMSNRMQPYGLMESRCYKESHDTLSCLTCHDPHQDASTSLHHYEAICLNCHTEDASRRPSALRTQAVHTCPVNPRSGCVGCHMPSRSAIPGTKLPTYMSDHDIAIYHSPQG